MHHPVELLLNGHNGRPKQRGMLDISAVLSIRYQVLSCTDQNFLVAVYPL